MSEILQYNHVDISYQQKKVVCDANFSVKKGEILGIVGESGSGKSTILKAGMGLLGKDGMVTQGDILYREKNLSALPEKEMRKICGKEIGMIFQAAGSSFCPIRTIRVQLLDCVSAHKKLDKKEFEEEACGLLSQMGFDDPKRILDAYPFELSGGMQQRVGIVAAMILRPSILLADEPTAALDVAVQKQVVEQLLAVREKFGTSIIIVTHNIGVVNAMADNILVLHHGQTVEHGKKELVLNQPSAEYTKELLGAVPKIRR